MEKEKSPSLETITGLLKNSRNLLLFRVGVSVFNVAVTVDFVTKKGDSNGKSTKRKTDTDTALRGATILD